QDHAGAAKPERDGGHDLGGRRHKGARETNSASTAISAAQTSGRRPPSTASTASRFSGMRGSLKARASEGGEGSGGGISACGGWTLAPSGTQAATAASTISPPRPRAGQPAEAGSIPSSEAPSRGPAR